MADERNPNQDDIPSAISSCTTKSVVEARFHLTEIRAVNNYGDGGFKTGKLVWIKMTAAKSGIFGKASPSGTLDLMIANPGAFRIFEQAFEEAGAALYDESVPAPKMGSKRFRLYIVEDEDQTPA